MSVIRDLMVGAAFLVPIGAGVGLVAVFGRDRTADEHDLSDYREPAAELEPRQDAPARIPTQRRDLAAMNAKPDLDELRERITAGLKSGRPEVLSPRMTVTERDVLPQVPAYVDAGTPPMARALLIEVAVPTLSDAVIRATADDWLREIAAEQQARAGIRPASEHWAGRDGSCWADCPACARDLVGAFPVVRAA